MNNGSAYLNGIYRDMVLNPIQNKAIDMPPYVGEGCISQSVTKQGIIVSNWKCSFNHDFNVYGTSREDYIQIIYCLGDELSWTQKDEVEKTVRNGHCCTYIPNGEIDYVMYRKETNFDFKALLISRCLFKDLLQDYLDSSQITLYEKKIQANMSSTPITPTMYKIIEEMENVSDYKGGLANLYLETKAIELLTEYLNIAVQGSVTQNTPLTASKRQDIINVKQMIDSRLAYAPSCGELARTANMSISKLTKEFSCMFGMPIHSYIIDQRIERAAKLLLETDLTVTEIAMIVGYSKPSNFSAAFKKKYGVVPSKYK